MKNRVHFSEILSIEGKISVYLVLYCSEHLCPILAKGCTTVEKAEGQDSQKEEESQKVGLKINISKIKVLLVNSTRREAKIKPNKSYNGFS
jgi:hypothetical protein